MDCREIDPVAGQANADAEYESQQSSLAAAEARGEARGRAAVLAEVAKLPSPVKSWMKSLYAPMENARMRCEWCRARWHYPKKHPDNNCLWIVAIAERDAAIEARAHAAGVAAPEER